MNNSNSCSNIMAAIETIIDGVDALCLSMINIDKISFHSIYSDFERLEESLNRKTFIDAAFAFMAERDEAGRLVGSSRATDYLINCLGLSRAEANQRLTAGRNLYEKLNPEPVPEPEAVKQEPIPEPDPDLSEEEQARER